MLIFMCIYAIIAVDSFQNFGEEGSYKTTSVVGELDENGEPRYRQHIENVTSVTLRGLNYGEEYYGSFSRSLFTLFQVLTGESWSEAVARPLVFGMVAKLDGLLVGLFFMSFIVLHQIVLVNVVVAVLVRITRRQGS
jgi:hypothetical protein